MVLWMCLLLMMMTSVCFQCCGLECESHSKKKKRKKWLKKRKAWATRSVVAACAVAAVEALASVREWVWALLVQWWIMVMMIMMKMKVLVVVVLGWSKQRGAHTPQAALGWWSASVQQAMSAARRAQTAAVPVLQRGQGRPSAEQQAPRSTGLTSCCLQGGVLLLLLLLV